ncbi:hypothetical protein O7635_02535 [Asanoa sp. WMMD1127]|uniref:CBM96 family carbohydrate-binding protein n=1 Tax=Asanoa sp. WMMD1127 TaxID=3016107 RepID=UPI002416AA66|nr:hypothetical protein [Asanoa sp. WMMD1127]MDG4820727.1 hypothetical protein [Asanoa sp. WMMD1127]
MRTKRALSAFVGALLGAAVLAVPAGPAQAYEQRDVRKSGWAYVDSRQPDKSFVNGSGDAPIGASLDGDGKAHRYRSYFTFDIARFKGSVVHQAEFVIAERSAADCASAQPVELWRTDPTTSSTTWNNRPRQRELLGIVQAGGATECPGHLVWDVLPALRKAADRGESTLTVEIRVPRSLEADVAHGRVLIPFPSLRTEYNFAPTVTRIGHSYPSDWICGTRKNPQPLGAHSYTLMVEGADADQFDQFYGIFAAWPVGHEDQRVEREGEAFGGDFSRIEWEMSQYPHGTVLAWTARADDGHDLSDWAKPCYVLVDSQLPPAPVVTSSTYPADGEQHGGEGVPGTFRVSANGDKDVVGYYWGEPGDVYRHISAPRPGGDVTFEYTPRSFYERLAVQTVDSAGNRSPVTTYEFFVRATAPAVTVTVGGVGLPSKVRIWTHLADVTEFGYRVGDGAEVRVPAGADGAADVTVVFPQIGQSQVHVRSYVGAELVGAMTESVWVTDVPTIESDDFSWEHDGVVGRPGTFTFRPGRAGVVAYEYAFNSGEGLQRIDADADGTAVLQWTPTQAGWEMLTVRSINADDTRSESAMTDFNVFDTRPYVYSSLYADYGANGGVGIPGEFQFDTPLPDAGAYVYQLNGGPEVVVDADPIFSQVTVTLTPDRSGPNTLRVRTRFLDGTLSPERTYAFEVSDAPVVVSTDYPANESVGQPGQPGRFTFKPGRGDVAEYRYALDGNPAQMVAAGPDGRATVDITPAHSGYNTLTVTSVAADGTTSAERRYSFQVRDPYVRVSSDYYEWVARGGLGSVAEFRFDVELADVSAFEYQVNGGPWHSVERSSTTTVSVTLDRNGENLLSVRGRTAAGTHTAQTDYPFLVGTAPLVSSNTYRPSGATGGVGVPGEFTFVQGCPGVVEFEYSDNDVEPTIVPADGQGRATITYTPETSSSHTMRVRGRTTDGVWSDLTEYYFYVAGN